jgi:alpha-L-fucosidase
MGKRQPPVNSRSLCNTAEPKAGEEVIELLRTVVSKDLIEMVSKKTRYKG